MIMFRRFFGAVRCVVLLAVLLSAVASDAFSLQAGAQESSPTAESRTEYPLTIQNCGVDLTLDAAPQRIVVMEAAAISILSEIGVLDRVVARLGTYRTEYFSPDVNEAIERIPELAADRGSTGGVVISLETVLDLQPDLIIGYETEAITRDALARFDIGLYVMPPYCTNPPVPSFESIMAEVRLYGQMFDLIEVADGVATALEQTVETVSAEPVAQGEAAALYISSDGSAIYGYSRLGMIHVQMEALGLVNIYADLPGRTPEVNMESLIEGNPDVVFILYSDPSTSPDEIRSLVTELPGAEAISAVRTGRVHPHLFNYSEPPSPLVVDGLVILQELLAP